MYRARFCLYFSNKTICTMTLSRDTYIECKRAANRWKTTEIKRVTEKWFSDENVVCIGDQLTIVQEGECEQETEQILAQYCSNQ